MTVQQLYDRLMMKANELDDRGSRDRAHELRAKASAVISAQAEVRDFVPKRRARG